MQTFGETIEVIESSNSECWPHQWIQMLQQDENTNTNTNTDTNTNTNTQRQQLLEKSKVQIPCKLHPLLDVNAVVWLGWMVRKPNPVHL